MDTLIDDLCYRIANLREAALQIVDLPVTGDDWESGYRHGRLRQIESELRFLEEFYIQLEQKQ